MLRAITGLLDVHRGEITRGSRSPSFEDLVLESGYNYCVESMNGLDWASETFGKPDTLMSVHYPGDYGGDSAAGVSHWATKNSVAFPRRPTISRRFRTLRQATRTVPCGRSCARVPTS